MLLYVPYIVAMIGTIIALALPRGKDLAVIMFMMPFIAFGVDFGVSLQAYEFVILILLIKYFVLGNLSLKKFIGGLPILGFFFLCILAAFITIKYGPEVPLFAGGGQLRNGWGRVFSVTLNFVISFSFLLLLFSVRSHINSRLMLETYTIACIILAVIGFIQLLVFIATGVDILPIGIMANSDIYRSGMLGFEGGNFLRVSSLGGEPKGLGQTLVIALSILALFRKEIGWSSWSFFAAITLLIGIIIATASTSAFIMLMTVVGFIFIFSKRKFPLLRSELRLFFFGISASMSMLYYGIALKVDNLTPRVFENSTSFLDALKARTIGRINFDDTDSVIWESFVGDYWGLILGRGLGLTHHFAYKFIPAHMERYMDGNIIPAKSGMSYYVGYGGLLGLFLITMAATYMVPIANMGQTWTSKYKMKIIQKFQILCLGLWAAHLLRLYTFDVTWAIFAIAAIVGFQMYRDDSVYI